MKKEDRICLYFFSYRFQNCEYRRFFVDGLWRCLCTNGECKECMERYSKPKEELDPNLLELLREINLKIRNGT